MVLEAPEDHPEWMLGAEVTDDGRCEAADEALVRARVRLRVPTGSSQRCGRRSNSVGQSMHGWLAAEA